MIKSISYLISCWTYVDILCRCRPLPLTLGSTTCCLAPPKAHTSSAPSRPRPNEHPTSGTSSWSSARQAKAWLREAVGGRITKWWIKRWIHHGCISVWYWHVKHVGRRKRTPGKGRTAHPFLVRRLYLDETPHIWYNHINYTHHAEWRRGFALEDKLSNLDLMAVCWPESGNALVLVRPVWTNTAVSDM